MKSMLTHFNIDNSDKYANTLRGDTDMENGNFMTSKTRDRILAEIQNREDIKPEISTRIGDARLQDYKTANKEEFTNQEFLNNKDLQEKVFDWHVGDIVKYIQDNNLDEAIGKKVNGVVITLNGLVAAAHLGGKFGMRQYVESGFDKKFNKEDSNGTSLFDYIQRFQLTK